MQEIDRPTSSTSSRRGNNRRLMHTAEVITVDGPDLRVLAPRTNNFKVAKRRSAHGRKGAHKQTAAPFPAIENTQLTEGDLFQLLIGKIKQREDDETTASNLRSRIEADIANLRSENKSLKDQMEACDSQLQKRTLEASSYKAHIDNWKGRIGKFKGILNGLGAEYQALRGESNHMKASGLSLAKERSELRCALSDIRTHVSQASSTISDRRNHLSESREIVNSLQASLRSSEAKVEDSRIRLADEKRRTAVLESYIQTHSHKQGKQLEVIQNGQTEIMRKMKADLDLIAKQWELSQSNLQSVLKRILDECLVSIKDLAVECSVDKIDVKQSTSRIKELISR